MHADQWRLAWRAAPAAEAAAFAAALWIAGSRGCWLEPDLLSAGKAAAQGGLWVAAAWLSVAGVALWACLAVSLADFRKLLWLSLAAAAPAMWLPPAVFLLATLSLPGAAAGMLLLGKAVRALASRRLPRRHTRRRLRLPWPEPPAMFRPLPPSRGRTPALLGAFALQLALLLIWTKHPLAAATLSACAAALWAGASIARGAWRPVRGKHLPAALLAFVLTTLLMVSLPPAGSGAAFLAGSGPPPDLGSLLARLAQTEPPKLPAPRQSVARLVGRPAETIGPFQDGIPGLVLRPAAGERPAWLAMRPSAPAAPRAVSAGGMTFAFTGEYHLFRASSGRVPLNSAVRHGSPLDAVYFTTHGGLMETHAWQRLLPAIDFSRCARVEVVISSGERLPASATLQLVTADRIEDLGTEIFGLGSADEESLEFATPVSSGRRAVNALRLVFHRNPSQRHQSVKVAVRRFTLHPRGF